jgi:NADH dehydrogenase/NADH:ubiquinone oxidoreductase subunit G
MLSLVIDGLPVRVEEGASLLEAARLYGASIPTLCSMDGLSPYGACRLCVVEIVAGRQSRLVSSCTHPALEGLVVRTRSARVVRTRRMILELLLATCPQSKTIQDLAAAHGVREHRFRQEHEPCILCGRCVRVCAEQMMAGAIGFRGRGGARTMGTPFDVPSAVCRACGACMHVCPTAGVRCVAGPGEPAVCGACAGLPPPCLEQPQFDDRMCPLEPCLACEILRGD